MEKKRPQLNLDELHQIKWLLGGLLALFSVWTVYYLEVEAWTLLILNTVGIIAALVRPDLPGRVPKWIHQAAFPVIVLIFLGDLWFAAQEEVLPPMIRLALMLILYRGITYRERRDDLQLVVLGLFLVVVTGVLTVSIGFAVQIIAFTACALLLLFVTTLVDAAEAKYPAPRTPLFTWGGVTIRPAWVERAEWGRLWPRLRASVDWRVGLFGSALFAGVVVVSALLFLAIPRFQLENSLFLERFISKKAKTGFSDNIKFGDVTDIMSDDSVALSIDVSDPVQVPTPLYLRMVVLDEYREGSFKLSTDLRRDAHMQRETNRSRIAGTEPPSKAPPVYWTFYLESGISRYLPLPGTFETLTFRETQNVAASTELRTVALHAEPVSMLAFRLDGVNTAPTVRDPEFARRFRQTRASSEALSGPAQRRMQLALPFSDADTLVLRQAISDFAPAALKSGAITSFQPAMSAEEFARLACTWLQAAHTYSLKSALPKGNGDPLVRWIDSKEPGHCELFAGSFVALARTAGFPARMVSGFRTGTWNGYSNSLSVRNSEAHAWCELWSDANGAWLRVDPTPGATAVANAAEQSTSLSRERQIDRSLKAWVNSLRVFWYRRIVNFDQRNQLDTLQNVKRVTQDKSALVRAAMEELMQALRVWLTSPWNLRRSIMVASAVLGMLGLGWCVRLFLRDWRWRFAKGKRVTKHDPVRAEAGRWLLKLGRAEQLEAHEQLEAVCEELQRLRYGSSETWPEPRLVFERARMAWRKAKRGPVEGVTR